MSHHAMRELNYSLLVDILISDLFKLTQLLFCAVRVNLISIIGVFVTQQGGGLMYSESVQMEVS